MFYLKSQGFERVSENELYNRHTGVYHSLDVEWKFIDQGDYFEAYWTAN